MTDRRAFWRASAAMVGAVAIMAAGTATADGQTRQPTAVSRHHHASQSMHLKRVLHPSKKYYGVYVSQAPSNMGPLYHVMGETGKRPNLSLYYRDWGRSAAPGYANIQPSAANHACQAGMLPMITWESWNASGSSNHRAGATQRAFAPAKIARGRYDRYIRATARAIKSINCPVALRFDQEMNSNWYPWGVRAPHMHNSARGYVKMWRHVWRVFHSVHAKNVVWVWSPNAQSRRHRGLPALVKSYPGRKYVDWIGIDGYFYHQPKQTFHGLFGPTMKQLSHFASGKPWIIAECGVGSGRNKPKQIRNMLAAVARSKRLNGVNYFDSAKAWDRSDWSFDQTPASLRAFKAGIHRRAFAAATPGKAPGQ